MNEINERDFQILARWVEFMAVQPNPAGRIEITEGKHATGQVINLDTKGKFESLGYSMEVGEAAGRLFLLAWIMV
jgi:hypothetical protein